MINKKNLITISLSFLVGVGITCLGYNVYYETELFKSLSAVVFVLFIFSHAIYWGVVAAKEEDKE